jgi:CRP-like cAMP-binding protein
MASVVANSTVQGGGSGEDREDPFLRPSAALERVLNANKRDFRAGTILTMEGGESGSVYVVLSGWLAVSKSLPDGARQIVDIVLRGELIDPSSADGDTTAVQVEALSCVTVAIVPRAAWRQLSEADPSVRNLQAMTIAAALSRMSERILRLGKASAESRIAYALIELCMRVSAIGGGDRGVYHLPLTQQHLGEYVGLSSVHVCRTMRRLTRSGVITMADHMNLVIDDLDRLAESAGVDVETLRDQIIGRRCAAPSAGHQLL